MFLNLPLFNVLIKLILKKTRLEIFQDVGLLILFIDSDYRKISKSLPITLISDDNLFVSYGTSFSVSLLSAVFMERLSKSQKTLGTKLVTSKTLMTQH